MFVLISDWSGRVENLTVFNRRSENSEKKFSLQINFLSDTKITPVACGEFN